MNLSVRDEKILYSLDKLGYATTSQLQRIHRLGSSRNAQRIMKRLAPYVHSRKLDEYVFYLSKKGREVVGSDIIRKATMQLQHAIMRTQAYITFNTPKIWHMEHPVTVNNEIFCIPDVTFAYDTNSIRYFVEIDCHQHMRNNFKKMDKYKELKEIANGKLPSLHWITRTAYRKERILVGLENRDLETNVHSLDDLR